MSKEHERTEPLESTPRKRPVVATSPQLFVTLQCADPLQPPSRHMLNDVDEVVVGRGARRSAERGSRRLVLRLPDAAMSNAHAKLTRVRDGRWLIEDTESRNGVTQNGVRVRRGTLRDGDLLSLGQTLFHFRDAVAAVRPGELDLDGAHAPSLDGLVSTFVASLADQYDAVMAIAPTPVPIIILGASGTGKDLVARAIHRVSRRTGTFVPVNCGAIPKELVEATLFGHRRGAFSGAVDDRPGVVRAADKGTLFLDEIGDLPLASQVAFLRVLQEQEVTPVGDARSIKVDFRLVAATHRSPAKLVEAGLFRHDLYARIAAFTISLPPLAERREDLGLVLQALLRRHAVADKLSFTLEAAHALLSHDWPLNVRELEGILRVAVALAGPAGRIDIAHLPGLPLDRSEESTPGEAAPAKAAPAAGGAADDGLREELTALLTEHGGNVSRVAAAMGKQRTQIHRWLQRFGLDLGTFRK